MKRPRFAALFFTVLGACAALVSGCGHKIGDTCAQNVDCSALGDRFCDLASPGGYCTLEGCDVRMDAKGNFTDSCPSESVCVRFFTPGSTECDHPNTACDPHVNKACCGINERCVRDCTPDRNNPDPNQCMGNSKSHCAPESSERRWCLLQCNTNADCRNLDQYECRAQGTSGAELVPNDPMPAAKFCVQKSR